MGKRLLSLSSLLFLALSLMAAMSGRAAENRFALELDSTDITSYEIAPLRAFLAEAEALLPPLLKERLNRPIQVRFKTVPEAPEELTLPPCKLSAKPDAASVNTVYGEIENRSALWLNRLFIPEILKSRAGAKTYACGHKNAYQLALAVLLHEVSHLYDFTTARKGKRAISRDPQYLTLSGWTETGFFFTSRNQANTLTSRSVDPYELKNTDEAFAVNMEFFLLDPEFRCRRPAQNFYLQRHFGFTPFGESQCRLNTTIALDRTNPLRDEPDPANLDPDRIYEIHYLLADKGPDLGSRWGHAMFRLIVCAPWRKEVGPACLDDIGHHIILSYRANVLDLKTDRLKGLRGKYPSRLYTFSLYDIIEEYTKRELRDVASYPLRLSPEEKRLFVYRALEQYWTYRGRYFFLSNNCATESNNLLKSSVSDRKAQNSFARTPIGLAKKLIRLGIADPAPLADPKKAVAEGYLFRSLKPKLDAALDVIRRAGDPLPYKDARDYIQKTIAVERYAYYMGLTEWMGRPDRAVASAFYLLESFALRTLQTNTAELVATVLLRSDEAPDEIREPLKQARQTIEHSLEDEKSLDLAQYGIPLAGENIKPPVASFTTPNCEMENLFRLLLRKSLAENLVVLENLRHFAAELKRTQQQVVTGPN